MGGILVDQLSWRYIFLISVPLAIAALAILYFRVPESRAASKDGQPDWKGALLATLGLGLICYSLIEASELGIYNPIVLSTSGAGILVFGAFIWLEQNIENPMVRLGMFRSMNFSGANLVTLFFYFSLAGVFFLLPFNLIQVQGYSATAAGAAFIPFPLLVGGTVTLVGGHDCSFWRKADADGRSRNYEYRIPVIGHIWYRKLLLELFFSGHIPDGPGCCREFCPYEYHCDEFCG